MEGDRSPPPLLYPGHEPGRHTFCFSTDRPWEAWPHSPSPGDVLPRSPGWIVNLPYELRIREQQSGLRLSPSRAPASFTSDNAGVLIPI